ncbi:transmembrane protein 127 [Xenopus laevis]|uniref:Transmembrane protein 127 n=2 Tax=Xenopus laevis TaxID=8355 RepID=A0A1L8HKN5_XENLA|nr:transmembrane protein 127 [Xenopus laevis]OCT96591.1 hypothetical protein XELAEV_18008797mg [Xenopus laevis]
MDRVLLGPRASVPQRCLAPALLQGFAITSLCTAIADPSWLLVHAGNSSYVYGVSYILHQGLSLTAGDKVLHVTWLYLLLVMALCCYLSILLGSLVFLLDFLDVRRARPVVVKVSVLLHTSTVLLTAASVTSCSYLYRLLIQEMKSHTMATMKGSVEFGESFCFAIIAGVMSLAAAAISFVYARNYRSNAIVVTSRLLTVETSPLLSESADPDTLWEYG